MSDRPASPADEGTRFRSLARAATSDADAVESARAAYQRGRRDADEARRERLHRMSHDLRTPLNSILGFAQLLELDDLDDNQRDAVEQILAAGNRMLEMVNSLVDDASASPADTDVSVESAPHPPAADEAVDTLRVVYVEDNLANVRLVERVFSLRPHLGLVAAARGDEGIEAVRAQQPDLVLLDLHLPDMHGVDVLRALKADARTRHIPVAVLTADATPGQIQPLAGEGARYHLTKPLDIEVLLSLIDDIAAEKRAAAKEPNT